MVEIKVGFMFDFGSSPSRILPGSISPLIQRYNMVAIFRNFSVTIGESGRYSESRKIILYWTIFVKFTLII